LEVRTYKRSFISIYDGRVNSNAYKNGPVGCEMRVFSPPQLLFVTFLFPINIQRVSLDVLAETHVGLNVKRS